VTKQKKAFCCSLISEFIYFQDLPDDENCGLSKEFLLLLTDLRTKKGKKIKKSGNLKKRFKAYKNDNLKKRFKANQKMKEINQ